MLLKTMFEMMGIPSERIPCVQCQDRPADIQWLGLAVTEDVVPPFRDKSANLYLCAPCAWDFATALLRDVAELEQMRGNPQMMEQWKALDAFPPG